MSLPLRAILVCVDYADLLAMTLPYNRHHFRDVMVVTNLRDSETVNVATENGASVYTTDSFYDRGAIFNKWKALEEGLDVFGREGWLCIMDADVLWPRVLPDFSLTPGYLYTPFRRMRKELTDPPPESEWEQYPRHRQEVEFAGYSQIFHASDPVLGPAPWHETNWRHAGGADSFFQRKWPPSRKVRPPFDVLHLGESGTNWCGRATAYADGSLPAGANDKITTLRQFIRGRRRAAGGDRFAHEKIG